MKKIIIAALVMLLVGTTAAFAIYDGSEVIDYAGFSVGASYVNEAYDVKLLGGGFYLSAGARASVYFLKWMTNEDRSWVDYESYSKDTENYFGWRGSAKLGVYYAF